MLLSDAHFKLLFKLSSFQSQSRKFIFFFLNSLTKSRNRLSRLPFTLVLVSNYSLMGIKEMYEEMLIGQSTDRFLCHCRNHNG